MTVVHYEQPPPLPASRPGQELEQGPVGDVARLRAAAEYAAYIADTEFVKDPLRGRPAAIAAAILAGGELGLKPIVALRVIAIIKGTPSVSAEGQRGLVTSQGHELWFEESTTTRAIAAGRRAGSDRVGRVTWTMDDAKRAGLAGQPNYQRYPAEMLRARASAALARSMFADVTLGIPASEELDDESPPNGNAVLPEAPADVPPAAPAGRARRRPKPKPEEPAREPLAPAAPPDTQEPPPPEEPLATDAYKKRIFATMRDLSIGAAGSEDERRAERLAYVSHVVGREVASSNDLTIGEASTLIDHLEAEKNARAASDEPAEPPPGPPPVTMTQRGTLLALLAEKGIEPAAERLAYLSSVADRPISSANDLTEAEADQVIEALRAPPPPLPENEQAVLDELEKHAQPADDDIPF